MILCMCVFVVGMCVMLSVCSHLTVCSNLGENIRNNRVLLCGNLVNFLYTALVPKFSN